MKKLVINSIYLFFFLNTTQIFKIFFHFIFYISVIQIGRNLGSSTSLLKGSL